MVDLEGICLSLPVVLSRSRLGSRSILLGSRSRLDILLGSRSILLGSRSRLVILLLDRSRSRLGVLLASRSCLVVVEHRRLSSRTLLSYCHNLPLRSRSSLNSRSSGSSGSST